MEYLRRIDFRREGKTLLRDYLLLFAGTWLIAVAFDAFFLPYHIAPGGVTGIATVLASFLPLSVGAISFLINVPLFLYGARSISWRFVVRSFIAMSLLSFFLDTMPVYDATGDILLAALFGSAVEGIGLGMVVRGGATTGGTDMAAQILHTKLPFLSVGAFCMLLDTSVVISASAVFGIQSALWSALAVAAASVCMDKIIRGFNTAMQFLIVTDAPENIFRRIHRELDRGCTRLYGEGTFSGRDTGILICVVSRVEAPRLRKIIAEEDGKAFVTLSDVNKAMGEGFEGIASGT